MSTILFDRIVYGPVNSRRLGVSLGINLSPTNGKRCSFDCIYCECGLNSDHKTQAPAPSRKEVMKALATKLELLNVEGIVPDRLTFSGNGEPTMHPDFGGIIDDTIAIRNQLCPSAKVAVLTNSTMLHKQEVMQALQKIDENLMKLDAATDTLIRQIDQPVINDFTADNLIEQLMRFDGKLTIQTMFLRGEHRGLSVDNTGDEDVEKWIEALKKIQPKKVMIYTISRETPIKTIQKVSMESLETIARKVQNAGFKVVVAG